MSMATLEKAVLAGAKLAFNNPKLTKNDIMEWSTSEIKAAKGEVVLRVPDPGVYVAIKAEKDKRNKL